MFRFRGRGEGRMRDGVGLEGRENVRVVRYAVWREGRWEGRLVG